MQNYDEQIAALNARLDSFDMSKGISRDTETALRERLGLSTTALPAWPVGSIFISTTTTNPATLLGYGTWVAFASGEVLVGYASLDSDFGTLLGTGGEKTHAISVSEMPAHSHPGTYASTVWNTNGANSSNLNTAASVAASVTPGIVSQGGGIAHNNIQPYIVVQFWKRTV